MSYKQPVKMNDKQAEECCSHKLIKIYKTEDGQKFIHHLVNAFYKSHRKFIVSPDDIKSELVDCITNRVLNPIYTEKPEKFNFAKTIEDMQQDSAIGSHISDKYLGKVELDCLNEWIEQQLNEGNETIKSIIDFNQKKDKQNSTAKKSHKPHSKGHYARRAPKRNTLGAQIDFTKIKESVYK